MKRYKIYTSQPVDSFEASTRDLPDNSLLAIGALSDESKLLISYRPHWLVRRGNLLFLLVLAGIVALSFFIRYPDIVQADARIVSATPPALTLAGSDGRLKQLLVKDGQQVHKGDRLAVIDSYTDEAQVAKLQQWLLTVLDERIDSIHGSTALPVLRNLGELQELYARLCELHAERNNTFFPQRSGQLRNEVAAIHQMRATIDRQVAAQQQEQAMQGKELEAYEKLAKDKVIAPLELNQYRAKWLAKERELDQLDAQLSANQLSLVGKSKEFADLKKSASALEQQWYSMATQLKVAIQEWMEKFIIIAPADGTVVFPKPILVNDWMMAGQPFCYIQSSQQSCYASISLGAASMTNVRAGQEVRLVVDGYPRAEYGILTARITQVSSLPVAGDSFMVKAVLTQQLKTSNGGTIGFREGLRARAEIVTRNRLLAERVLLRLKSAGN